MSWLRNHPYAIVSALIGLFLVTIILIVESRTSVSPGPLSVWGGGGAPLLNPTSYLPSAQGTSITREDRGPQVAPIYIPPTIQRDETETESTTEEFDFDVFLSTLTEPKSQTGGSATSPDVSLAYSFIPQGLISTTTPAPRKTEAQQKLYTYGNDAASYIQTYEDSNRNAGVALRDQAEDRQNPEKKQAVKLIAAGLRTVGESLLQMEEVPSTAKSIHTALAESYIESGKALAKVPDANGDSAFIAAIEAYNSTADELVKNYIALATVFSVSGVKFATEDPGSIFTFSGGGGL